VGIKHDHRQSQQGVAKLGVAVSRTAARNDRPASFVFCVGWHIPPRCWLNWLPCARGHRPSSEVARGDPEEIYDDPILALPLRWLRPGCSLNSSSHPRLEHKRTVTLVAQVERCPRIMTRCRARGGANEPSIRWPAIVRILAQSRKPSLTSYSVGSTDVPRRT